MPAEPAWPISASSCTGGAGFLGRRVVARARTARDADVVVPRSADYDLTLPGAAEQLLADHQPSDRRPPRRPRRRDRVQPGRAGAAVPRQPADGHARHRGRSPRAVASSAPCCSARCARTRSSRPCRSARTACGTATPRRPTRRTAWPRRPTSCTPRSTRTQYGQRFAYLIPTNLYGPGDKFHPAVSHVIPALIKKCVEARRGGRGQGRRVGHRSGQPRVPLRRRRRRGHRAGGRARRVSDGVVEPINLGTDREVTIRETVETIARLVGFDGELRWDPTKPDGQPRRRVDASRAEQVLGWRARTSFDDGLRATIDWYLANREEAERATVLIRGSRHPRVRRRTGRRHALGSVVGEDAGGDGGRAVGGGQGVDRLVGVEPARVGDRPRARRRTSGSGWRPSAPPAARRRRAR